MRVLPGVEAPHDRVRTALLPGQRRHGRGGVEHDLVLLLRHLRDRERHRRGRHVDGGVDTLVVPLARDRGGDVRLVLVIGADQLHVEAEMRLHLVDRELRRGDRGGTGIVTIGAAEIGQHTELDDRPGLRHGRAGSGSREGGGTGKQCTACERHGRITPGSVTAPGRSPGGRRLVTAIGRSGEAARVGRPPAQSCRRTVSVRFTKAASSACCRVPVLAKTC